ncbi:MAG: flagellar hook basal-body protein, partial [Proteobacteria bacterium]|nr:flagellar hook basal-body protein [Pseudomonadota bacterium]
MSIYSALNVGVSGVQSQSRRLSVISDNISNVNTVGYKQAEASFANIVAYDVASTYSPGGVRASSRVLAGSNGLLRPTNNGTDLGISGDGMFVVSESAKTLSNLRYTRAGAFQTDKNGNLVNEGGFYLLG